MESNESLRKKVNTRTKNKSTKVLVSLSFFVLISILVFTIGFFAPISLFITVPFLLLPALFSLEAVNVILERPDVNDISGFFIMFKAYFSPLFRGGYKVIINFLKSLLVYLIVSSVISTVLITVVLENDPEYLAFIEQTKDIANVNEILDKLIIFQENSTKFNMIVNISGLVSYFFGFYVFFHFFHLYKRQSAVNTFNSKGYSTEKFTGEIYGDRIILRVYELVDNTYIYPVYKYLKFYGKITNDYSMEGYWTCENSSITCVTYYKY